MGTIKKGVLGGFSGKAGLSALPGKGSTTSEASLLL